MWEGVDKSENEEEKKSESENKIKEENIKDDSSSVSEIIDTDVLRSDIKSFTGSDSSVDSNKIIEMLKEAMPQQNQSDTESHDDNNISSLLLCTLNLSASKKNNIKEKIGKTSIDSTNTVVASC